MSAVSRPSFIQGDIVHSLCTLDILGNEVSVYGLSDDEMLELGDAPEAGHIAGSYDVAQARIYLNLDMASTHLRPTLAHEVTEYLLGYLRCIYDPEQPHDSFQDFWRVLWHVHEVNKEYLYGDRLEKIAEKVKAGSETAEAIVYEAMNTEERYG